MRVALAFAAGYVVGSVPLGLLVGRALAGIDIREHGTGNMGAANVFEHVGALGAAIVAPGLFLQGLLPPLVTRRLGGSRAEETAAAVGAVTGYGWPVFVGFKGGRGLATGAGAAAALSPGGFAALSSAFVLGALLRQTSLGPLLGFVLYAAYVFRSTRSVSYRLGSVLLLGLISARRLEGLGRELERGPFFKVFFDLLLFQRRPEPPDGARGPS